MDLQLQEDPGPSIIPEHPQHPGDWISDHDDDRGRRYDDRDRGEGARRKHKQVHDDRGGHEEGRRDHDE
eukprot:3206082-Heterocapsa_arctica.AAC.1